LFVAACGKVAVDIPEDPSCEDGELNGNESDVDCGGDTCGPCPDLGACLVGGDCESGVCGTSRTCTPPTCNDGVKNGDELDADCAGSCGVGTCKVGQTCDDNTQCETQLCAHTFQCIASKRVFLTQGRFTGSQIGGLTGADAKCQAEAIAAGLTGQYKAWLSDLTGSPSTRFKKSVLEPYVRTDGLVLAANFADLIDGTLGGPIDRNAANQPVTGAPNFCDATAIWVFSNTSQDGTLAADSLSCNNWTSDTGGSFWGRHNRTDSLWTTGCSGGQNLCGVPGPFYCFEQ
jgi:hypothetical protein